MRNQVRDFEGYCKSLDVFETNLAYIADNPPVEADPFVWKTTVHGIADEPRAHSLRGGNTRDNVYSFDADHKAAVDRINEYLQKRLATSKIDLELLPTLRERVFLEFDPAKRESKTLSGHPPDCTDGFNRLMKLIKKSQDQNGDEGGKTGCSSFHTAWASESVA